jgi:hypothetical protein
MTWADLVAAATVGTDRRPGRNPQDLLDAAVTGTLYRRAGVSPVVGLPAPAPAPAETVPVAPPAAASRVAALLALPSPHGGPGGPDGEARIELLAEWLRLAAVRGLRIPAEQLPALLDTGLRHRELRPLILAAGGARAGWLAAMRPDWGYLAQAEDDRAAENPAAWAEGTPGQRTGYLAAYRRRDPRAARELLAAEWGTLAPDERGQLIRVLAAGLTADDEEFLEAALDDRRKEVRDQAAELLGRLPSSAYARRMVRRATACLRLEGRTVTVIPPGECDKGMRRDGIAMKPPVGTGERAWWLEEILSRTPLSTWAISVAGSELDEDWADPVRRGLARAAAAQQDSTWAAALLARLPASPTRPDDRLLVEALYAALAPADLMARTGRALREAPDTAGLDRMLELCAAPWPAGFGASVLAAVGALVRQPRSGYRVEGICRLAAVRLHPTMADPAAALAAAIRAESPDNYRLHSLDRMADTLRFRCEMTEELA